MSTLILWKLETAEGARRAGRALLGLSAEERECVHDAAWVSWRRSSGKPTTGLLTELGSEQALGEAFWGVLFGLLFYSPLLGAAMVGPTEAFTGSLADVGIDETFVNRARDTVTPGTSALFVLGSDALVDYLRSTRTVEQPVKLLVTKLSRRQEEALRQVFVG